MRKSKLDLRTVLKIKGEGFWNTMMSLFSLRMSDINDDSVKYYKKFDTP